MGSNISSPSMCLSMHRIFHCLDSDFFRYLLGYLEVFKTASFNQCGSKSPCARGLDLYDLSQQLWCMSDMIERARGALVIGRPWPTGGDGRMGIRYWRFPITQYMWPSSRLRTAHPTKYSFIGNACSLIYALRLLIVVRFEAAWQTSSAVNISQQAIKWFLSFHSLNVDWVPLRLRRRLLILHSTRQWGRCL